MKSMTEFGNYRKADRELKREVLNRLIAARMKGVSTGKIAKESGDSISIHTIYDMMEAKCLSKEIWEMVSEGLKKLGY